MKAGLGILSPSVSYRAGEGRAGHPVYQCILQGCRGQGWASCLPVYLTGLVKAGLDILSPSVSYRVVEGRARHPVSQCILQGW